MKINSLNDLLVEMLKDMYSAETQLVEGLEKMVKKANSKELKQAFEEHLQETKEQITRLEQACSAIDVDPKGETCEVMQGLMTEAEEIMDETTDKDVLDAALIASAQRVEHYEIASYGTILTYAKMLDDKKVADLLSKTIQEEKNADGKLTQIAEKMVNQKALH